MAALEVVVDPSSTELEVVMLSDRAHAEAQLRDGSVDAVVVDDRSVLVLESIDAGTSDLLRRATSTASLADHLETSPPRRWWRPRSP